MKTYSYEMTAANGNGGSREDPEKQKKEKTRHIPKMHYIDRICQIAIPLSYVLFNIIYFTHFLTFDSHHERK